MWQCFLKMVCSSLIQWTFFFCRNTAQKQAAVLAVTLTFLWPVSACSRIVQMRYPNAPSLPAAVPSTPNHSQRSFYASQTSSKPYDSHSNSSQSTSSSGTLTAGQVPGVGEAGVKAAPVEIDRQLIVNVMSAMRVISEHIIKSQVNVFFSPYFMKLVNFHAWRGASPDHK